MSEESAFVLSLINKAKDLFLFSGKVDFLFKELQNKVGCSRSKIYQYFESKKEIYRIFYGTNYYDI